MKPFHFSWRGLRSLNLRTGLEATDSGFVETRGGGSRRWRGVDTEMPCSPWCSANGSHFPLKNAPSIPFGWLNLHPTSEAHQEPSQWKPKDYILFVLGGPRSGVRSYPGFTLATAGLSTHCVMTVSRIARSALQRLFRHRLPACYVGW